MYRRDSCFHCNFFATILVSNNTVCYENTILATRAAFMRQGNSGVIILLHLGTRSACSGIYLRTEESYPILKAVGFVGAMKHKPTCLVDKETL